MLKYIVTLPLLVSLFAFMSSCHDKDTRSDRRQFHITEASFVSKSLLSSCALMDLAIQAVEDGKDRKLALDLLGVVGALSGIYISDTYKGSDFLDPRLRTRLIDKIVKYYEVITEIDAGQFSHLQDGPPDAVKPGTTEESMWYRIHDIMTE